MKRLRLFKFILMGLSLTILFQFGCSLNSLVMSGLANSLSHGTSTFATDNDPRLIAKALPFSLKLMESVLQSVPKNRGLLTTLCKAFTEYAYGFVEQKSDFLMNRNYHKSLALRHEAKNLYLRARNYGFRGLNVSHPSFIKEFKKNPLKALKAMRPHDVALLYWTGVAWMGAISLGQNDPRLLADIPLAKMLVQRAFTLNPNFDDGTIQSFLITEVGSLPQALGGSPQKARKYLKEAIKLTHGLSASPYVNFAESVDVQEQNLKEFKSMLKHALQINVNKKPKWRLMNLIMQKRARWLLRQQTNLFVQ